VRRDGREDPGHFARAEHGVDLGDLLAQLVAVALGQAARDDEALADAGLLERGHLEDGVHRLLLGAIDEGARVPRPAPPPRSRRA
jgi:hypothetical protein